jgi:hypothetical protein
MDYLSSGYIETKLQDDSISLGTYWIARICWDIKLSTGTEVHWRLPWVRF